VKEQIAAYINAGPSPAGSKAKTAQPASVQKK
jgi:hypothetical protein